MEIPSSQPISDPSASDAPGWFIRLAVPAEIPILVAFRLAMFDEMGELGDEMRITLAEANRAYLEQSMAAGTYRAWVAEADGEVVASGGVTIRVAPPTPRNPAGREGYILNVFTRPDWRRKGIAEAIMHTILGVLRAEDIHVVNLRASNAGRPLYEKLGFTDIIEMRLRF
jgi:GNAT superfamily N-acetyltransferase